MAFLTGFLAEIPKITSMPKLSTGMDWLMTILNSWIGNFALTIIIFTIVLKLLTFPLDYLSKKTMKKNAMIQKKLAPQLAKLEKACGDDKKAYQAQSYALMQKAGYRMAGMCLPTLLTLGIFIWLFYSMGNFTAYTNAQIYNEMVDGYNTYCIEESVDGTPNSSYIANKDEQDAKMVSLYKKINPQFLWIKNPLRPDAVGKDAQAIATYAQVTSKSIGSPAIKIPGGSVSDLADEDEQVVTAKENYNLVMSAIDDHYGDGINGWFLLPFIAAAASLFSQWINQKGQPKQPGSSKSMTIVMMIAMPALMFYFAIRYTSALAIYIILNSLITALSTFIINKIVDKKYKDIIFESPTKKVSYSR